MKRILPLLLAVVLVMGLFAGCGNETYETPVITNVDDENNSVNFVPVTAQKIQAPNKRPARMPASATQITFPVLFSI